MRVVLLAGAAVLATLAFVPPARAGVVNPDISLIGQPIMRWTDAPGDPASKRPTLSVGETELMVDAPLNPYARGTAVLSFADGGVDVEEAFFLLERGLPLGLAVKGGKYRVGFGKLNPAHPHTYPFADRPHVLAAYLPGTEAFNETGVQLNKQFALPKDIALTASADWLEGDSFHPDSAGAPRPAGLGRLSAFIPIGDRSGLELGSSYTQGTNDVAAATRTAIAGGDLKLKYWTSANGYVLVQGEFLALDREALGWNGLAFVKHTTNASGGYAFVDWNPSQRYDAGVSAESYEDPLAGGARASAFGAFAGIALMEETTSFRLGYERYNPAHPNTVGPDATNTITLRVLYSMGPHKAHQF
jgi:hypothetical protein